jgi:hypothetical protein
MYDSLKKASAIAATTMAATPQVAPTQNRDGRIHYRGEVHVPDLRGENPREKLAAEADEACRNLRELEGLIGRAKDLCNLAERAPYTGGNWTAEPTPQQAADIREARRVLEEFCRAWQPTFKQMEAAVEKFNLKLRGS